MERWLDLQKIWVFFAKFEKYRRKADVYYVDIWAASWENQQTAVDAGLRWVLNG